jgi:hypothetical protein
MVNILEAVYFATAFLLLMALVRFVMSRRATGEDRAILVEKARRYFILAGVMGLASIGGYTVLEVPDEGPATASAVAAAGAPTSAPAAGAPAQASAPGPSTIAPAAWTLVPGRGAIGIGTDATHDALRARLGDSLVVTQTVDGAAGGQVTATVLFPGDPLQRIEVLWHDDAARTRPAFLRVRGTASRWRLASGATLGTAGPDGAPLRELRVEMLP